MTTEIEQKNVFPKRGWFHYFTLFMAFTWTLRLISEIFTQTEMNSIILNALFFSLCWLFISFISEVTYKKKIKTYKTKKIDFDFANYKNH